MDTKATASHNPVPFRASNGEVDVSPPVLLAPRDAARTLAISERTLWTLTHRGDISAVRIGRAVRYDLADLRQFVARAKTEGGRNERHQ